MLRTTVCLLVVLQCFVRCCRKATTFATCVDLNGAVGDDNKSYLPVCGKLISNTSAPIAVSYHKPNVFLKVELRRSLTDNWISISMDDIIMSPAPNRRGH